ncbi:MAG: hypothetical protein V4633_17205 [Pseudomonadota bacterium]
MKLQHRIAGLCAFGLATLAAAAEPAPITLAQARALAGSYQLAPGHVIDMGPMDEAGGQLIFLDSKTRRMGPLHNLSDTRFISGHTIGSRMPVAIRAEFIKTKDGKVTAMRWTEGQKTVTAKK